MASKRKSNSFPMILISVLAIVLLAVVLVTIFNPFSDNKSTSSKKEEKPITSAEANNNKPVSVTIGSTGDILIHNSVFNSVYDSSSDVYDFNPIFEYATAYYSKYDFMVANLEVTLGGKDEGYSGYPMLNCPDSIVDALKSSGFDMLLTANNHSYDTTKNGFNRTMQVLGEKKMPFIGTRNNKTDKNYTVNDIAGIKIGMVNYTYSTTADSGSLALNGNTVDSDTATKINTFDIADLDAFYDDMQKDIKNMYSDGAEAIMLYIHWGNEYNLDPSSQQKEIAQKMCDMGVDVIVGDHPHVVEPIEVLSSNISNKQTVCLYSTGNALSNQRKQFMDMDSGHTEDGIIFETKFTKSKDGKVVLDDVSVLPTWVLMYSGGNGRVYKIIPLDKSADWSSKFGLESTKSDAEKSYERTMKLVSDGLEQFKAEYKKTDLKKK